MVRKITIISWMLLVIVTYLSAANVPSKPTNNKIAHDLIGTRLTEGKADGWYSDDWHWNVQEGEIKALKILSILENSETDYCVLALIKLQGDVNAYNAKVKISYRLNQKNHKWEMEYAVSKGMDIVRTHKYDDCLSFSIVDDGWGGVNQLQIKNNSGIELGCAGYIRAGGEWRKFAVIIEPYKKGGVGGTFGGGNVTEYKIEFIERP